MTLSLETIKPFIDWLEMNPGWAALATFILSCAESLAIVGLFIPGTIVMPAIGSMIGAGVLPAWPIIIAAILGAIVGDSSSYWLGYYFHGSIRRMWPFNHFPRLLSSGEQFFLKYGGMSVFIGRFVGPVRPIIPVVAGMMNMPPLNFFIANLTSAIAWAIAYMAPGFLLGAISEQLAPHTAARLLVMLAIATIAAWLLWWLFKKIWYYFEEWLQKYCHRFWQYVKHSENWQWLYTALKDHQHPNSHRPLLIALSSLPCYLAFFILTFFVIHHTKLIAVSDKFTYLFLRSFQSHITDVVMAHIHAAATNSVFITLLIAAPLYLIIFRNWRACWFWLINLGFTWSVVAILKAYLKTPRPLAHYDISMGWSYPGLHSALMVAIIGSSVMLLMQSVRRRQIPLLLSISSLLIFIIALPQLYFGINWLSDELGGILIALAIAMTSTVLYHRHPIIKINSKYFIIFIIICMCVPTLWLSKTQAGKFLEHFQKNDLSYQTSFADWWTGKPLPISVIRTNLFDQPTELMTIQYTGSLSTLTKLLEKNGWQQAPNPSLAVILNRIGAKDRLSQLPLFPDLYQAQKPALIMTKKLHSPERLLVLRLWSSHLYLQPQNHVLWLGTLHYHQPFELFKHRHQEYHEILAKEEPALLSQFSILITNHFYLRWQTYHLGDCLHNKQGTPCQNHALLISQSLDLPNQELNTA